MWRVPFDVVSVALDKLDQALVDEQITLSQYHVQHDAYMYACGWTMLEYEHEIDRRWDDMWVANVIKRERVTMN